MSKYVCQTKCYYLETLWMVGDELPPGLEPNKHFVRSGEFQKETPPPKMTAGDDARPTSVIIDRLKKVFGISVEPGTSRKEAWKLEQEMDAGKKEPKNGKPAKSSDEKKKDTPPVDPSTLAPFCNMSADELNGMKCKEISDHCKAKYGVAVPSAGISKTNLIKKVVEVEEANLKTEG